MTIHAVAHACLCHPDFKEYNVTVDTDDVLMLTCKRPPPHADAVVCVRKDGSLRALAFFVERRNMQLNDPDAIELTVGDPHGAPDIIFALIANKLRRSMTRGLS